MKLFRKQDQTTLLEEILKLKERVSLLERDVLDLNGANKTIKDKIMKRFQGKKSSDDEKTQDLYNGVLISE